jgi:hypothetical protein
MMGLYRHYAEISIDFARFGGSRRARVLGPSLRQAFSLALRQDVFSAQLSKKGGMTSISCSWIVPLFSGICTQQNKLLWLTIANLNLSSLPNLPNL